MQTRESTDGSTSQLPLTFRAVERRPGTLHQATDDTRTNAAGLPFPPMHVERILILAGQTLGIDIVREAGAAVLDACAQHLLHRGMQFFRIHARRLPTRRNSSQEQRL